MERLHSYPKIYALGHRYLSKLFDGEVTIQEKVDGSQFTFGMIDGCPVFRSKGQQIFEETADKLFRPAVDTVLRLFKEGKLTEGWQYRGETLCKPKHNTKEYSRVPVGNIILFDVDTNLEDRVDSEQLKQIGLDLGLEVVPVMYRGPVEDAMFIKDFLELESVLGGTKVEGVVIKNYDQFGVDGKQLMAKIVSEEFKEAHQKGWNGKKKTKEDLIQLLINTYRTEPRWQKAIQHLRDDGKLNGDPSDIGNLIKAVQADVLAECKDEIAESLFKEFWPQIQRGITGGLPEWYKSKLTDEALAA